MKDDVNIEEAVRRRAAVDGSCDVRTVDRVLRGKPVRGLAGERARAALKALGIDAPPAQRWRPTKGRR